MTTADSLLEDLSRARERVRQQERRDPDHEVALAMYRADVRRARQAIEDFAAAARQVQVYTTIGEVSRHRVMGGQVVEVKG